jgi:serine/threonine protein kinase
MLCDVQQKVKEIVCQTVADGLWSTRFCDASLPGNLITVNPVALIVATGFSWEKQDYVFYGTVDFASVRSLKGYHPTPKDDLESLACVLLEMATGL